MKHTARREKVLEMPWAKFFCHYQHPFSCSSMSLSSNYTKSQNKLKKIEDFFSCCLFDHFQKVQTKLLRSVVNIFHNEV